MSAQGFFDSPESRTDARTTSRILADNGLCRHKPLALPFVLTQNSASRFVSALTCGVQVSADTNQGREGLARASALQTEIKLGRLAVSSNRPE